MLLPLLLKKSYFRVKITNILINHIANIKITGQTRNNENNP